MSPKLLIGLALLVVCGGSIAWRAALDGPESSPETTRSAPADAGEESGGTGFLPGTPGGSKTPDPDPQPTASAPDEEPRALEEWLPVVTESTFFGFIGFALGYFSRKVLKLMMIFIALLFIVLQGLSYAEVITLDWGRAIELVNTWILGLKENQTVTEILKNRIPAAGGLFAGLLLGWRRG